MEVSVLCRCLKGEIQLDTSAIFDYNGQFVLGGRGFSVNL